MKTKFYLAILTLTSLYFTSCSSTQSTVASVQYPTNINLNSGSTEAERRQAAYRAYQAIYSTLEKETGIKQVDNKQAENQGAAAPYMICMGQK